MAEFLKELGTYCQSNGLGTLQTNLFEGWKPAVATNPYTVMLESVPAPKSTNGSEMVQREIQFLSFGATYYTARAECAKFPDHFINKTGISLTSWQILAVTGADPGYIGLSPEGGRHEFSTNLLFKIKARP